MISSLTIKLISNDIVIDTFEKFILNVPNNSWMIKHARLLGHLVCLALNVSLESMLTGGKDESISKATVKLREGDIYTLRRERWACMKIGYLVIIKKYKTFLYSVRRRRDGYVHVSRDENCIRRILVRKQLSHERSISQDCGLIAIKHFLIFRE